MISKNCSWCATGFETKFAVGKYCSDKCHKAYDALIRKNRRIKLGPSYRIFLSENERLRQARHRSKRIPWREGICMECGSAFKFPWKVGFVSKSCSGECKQIRKVRQTKNCPYRKTEEYRLGNIANARRQKTVEYQLYLIPRMIAEVVVELSAIGERSEAMKASDLHRQLTSISDELKAGKISNPVARTLLARVKMHISLFKASMEAKRLGAIIPDVSIVDEEVRAVETNH